MPGFRLSLSGTWDMVPKNSRQANRLKLISFILNWAHNSLGVFEGGFAILMTRKDWGRPKGVFMNGESATMSTDPGMAILEIPWL